jgi:hypothetical protein
MVEKIFVILFQTDDGNETIFLSVSIENQRKFSVYLRNMPKTLVEKAILVKGEVAIFKINEGKDLGHSHLHLPKNSHACYPGSYIYSEMVLKTTPNSSKYRR